MAQQSYQIGILFNRLIGIAIFQKKTMKRFIFRSLAFSCIVFILLTIIVGICSWNYKRLHPFLEGYGLKEKLLADVSSPRVIFQGGSNISFGINSKAVEDSLRMKTINVALHMGLGLRLMLSEVLDYCREGDILVLSPEYEHFYGGAYGSSETIAMIASLYPGVTKYFNTKQFLCAAAGFPYEFQKMKDQFAQSLDHTINHQTNDPQNIPQNNLYCYSSLSFNSYGDEERHWSYPNDCFEINIEHIPGTFDEEYFEEFCKTIDTFEARGVNVILIPPAAYTGFYEEEKEKMHYVAERLQMVGHPFEYEQELSIFDKSDMFDSSYHLAKSGIDKRMELIIDVLQSYK